VLEELEELHRRLAAQMGMLSVSLARRRLHSGQLSSLSDELERLSHMAAHLARSADGR
jgi:enoyl-CoA hydratase/carnithine racemase